MTCRVDRSGRDEQTPRRSLNMTQTKPRLLPLLRSLRKRKRSDYLLQYRACMNARYMDASLRLTRRTAEKIEPTCTISNYLVLPFVTVGDNAAITSADLWLSASMTLTFHWGLFTRLTVACTVKNGQYEIVLGLVGNNIPAG